GLLEVRDDRPGGADGQSLAVAAESLERQHAEVGTESLGGSLLVEPPRLADGDVAHARHVRLLPLGHQQFGRAETLELDAEACLDVLPLDLRDEELTGAD